MRTGVIVRSGDHDVIVEQWIDYDHDRHQMSRMHFLLR